MKTPHVFFDPVGYKEVYAFRWATSQHGNKQNPLSSEEFRHPDIQECPVMQRIIQYIFWINVLNLIRCLAINDTPFGILMTYIRGYEMPFSKKKQSFQPCTVLEVCKIRQSLQLTTWRIGFLPPDGQQAGSCFGIDVAIGV